MPLLAPPARTLPSIALALMLAPSIARAQQEPLPESLFTAADIPCFLLMAAVFFALIGVLVWYFLRGYSDFSETTSVVEATFEADLLQNLPQTRPTPAPAPPTPAAFPIHPLRPAGTAPPPATPPAGDDRLEALARRLQQLTILGDRQGQVTLPVPPHGVIHGLRKGGTALLLPRLESMETLAHFARRFDVVIVAPPGSDDPLIFSRLQVRLTDLMDRPGDFHAPKL